jgi:uncharacterized protein (TIGR03435 family)
MQGIAMVVALFVPGMIITAAQNQPLKFEVVSIKPNRSANGSWRGGCANGEITSAIPAGRCMATNASLRTIIALAYDISIFSMDQHIVGIPAGISNERYDIDAKAENPSATGAELRLMLQNILADRFKVRLHEETLEVAGYTLLVGKGGPKLKTIDESRRDAVGSTRHRMIAVADTAATLATMLSSQLGQPVVDRTKITGNYAFNLSAPEPDDQSPPSIFTALQEQLGLKLESQKVPTRVLVIDHAEKPSEN